MERTFSTQIKKFCIKFYNPPPHLSLFSVLVILYPKCNTTPFTAPAYHSHVLTLNILKLDPSLEHHSSSYSLTAQDYQKRITTILHNSNHLALYNWVMLRTTCIAISREEWGLATSTLPLSREIQFTKKTLETGMLQSTFDIPSSISNHKYNHILLYPQ